MHVHIHTFEVLHLILPILTNCGLSSLPSVSNQLGVVNAITTRTNATAVHIAAALPVLVFPIAYDCHSRYLIENE